MFAVLGCASVDSTPDRAAAQREIAERIGETSAVAPAAAGNGLEAIAAGGFDLEECARAAVLSRPEVAEAFARIGVARANRAQAGLMSNPTLTAGYLVTDGIGPDKRQLAFVQPIAEAFELPARIRAAQFLLDGEIRRAAAIAVSAAADARAAWRRVRALERAVAVEDEAVALALRAANVASSRLESGSISEFEVALARSAVAESELARGGLLGELALARVEFAAAVGCEASSRPETSGPDEARMSRPFALERGLEIARQRRLEARVAALELAAARVEVEREEGRRFVDVRVGVSFEKVIDALLGPVLTLTLPIFDRGEARIAAARARVEVAEQRARAVSDRIDREVLAATTRLGETIRTAAELRDTAIPAAAEVAALAQARFENGADDIDPWLEALGALLDRRRSLARSEIEIAAARSDLERALGAWPIPE